jgi:putative DNA primase/helicase
MAHGDMLEAVTELVKLGATGHRGVAEALDVAREVYAARLGGRRPALGQRRRGQRQAHRPAAGDPRDPEAERKAIAERNRPEVVEQVSREKRADKVATRIEHGAGQLTDAALAEVLADELEGQWANDKGQLLRWSGIGVGGRRRGRLVEVTRRALRRIRADETRAAILRGDKKHEDEAKAIEGRTRIVAVAELVAGILVERTPHRRAPRPAQRHQRRRRPAHRRAPPARLAAHAHQGRGVRLRPRRRRTLWHKALEALPPKVAAWVQVRMGQALTGYTPDDAVMPIFEGSGENGKSTVIDGIRNTFGQYAVQISDRLLLANPGDHPTELTDLMGKRLALFEEMPEGRNLNVKRLKDVVGTTNITARRMRQDNVTFPATHAIAGSTNYRLVVAETDHGTWRRLALVLFPYRYVKPGDPLVSPRDRRGDPRLKPHFEHHADPGTLAWLVAGAQAWYANGMTMPRPPKKVQADTEDWRLEADPVLSYVRERLELDPEPRHRLDRPRLRLQRLPRAAPRAAVGGGDHRLALPRPRRAAGGGEAAGALWQEPAPVAADLHHATAAEAGDGVGRRALQDRRDTRAERGRA